MRVDGSDRDRVRPLPLARPTSNRVLLACLGRCRRRSVASNKLLLVPPERLRRLLRPANTCSPRKTACGGLARDSSSFALAPRGGGLAGGGRQLDLPQSDRPRRHLDALVLAGEIERPLERERPRRGM